MLTETKKEFLEPSSRFRVKPFWFWNGEMDDGEIVRQLTEMAKKGIGGVFFCARQGMTLPYLSDAFFDKIKFAADTAQSLGLEIWLYDEMPYPSGMSGGEVTLRCPDARQTFLDYRALETDGGPAQLELGWGRVLCARAVSLGGDGASVDLENSIGNFQAQQLWQESGLTPYNTRRFFTYGPQKRLTCTLPKGRWKIEVYLETPREDFKYFGCLVDPCSRKATETFLETTYVRYRDCLGDRFGGAVKGFFTDEIGLLSPLPWSHQLPEQFRRETGRALAPLLYAVHDHSAPGAYAVRYELFRAAHHLLRENYHHVIADWCEKNHLVYVAEVPGMRMTTQLYSGIVGGDFSHEKLGRSLDWVHDAAAAQYRHNPKAIASLSRQLGHSRALVESFHSVGWSMTLQDAKWMLDYLTAAGINQYNFHAFFYTVGGLTKYDAPPSQFLQNPYWKHYQLFADYAARCSVLSVASRPAGRVAVLDPVDSLWVLLGNPFECFDYGGSDPEEQKRLDTLKRDWACLRRILYHSQLEFDHLDTEMLSRAEIRDGELRIGDAVYDLILLSPSVCMEQRAAETLERFADAGGKLLGIGLLPYVVIDGDQDPRGRFVRLFGEFRDREHYWGKPGSAALHMRPDRPNLGFLETRGPLSDAPEGEALLAAAVESLCPQPVRFCPRPEDRRDFVSHLRENQDGWWCFVANQSELTHTGTLRAGAGVNAAELYDAETGGTSALDFRDGAAELTFAPYESRWVRLWQARQLPEPARQDPVVRLCIDLNREMKLTVSDQNLLRLDSFQLSCGGGEWRPVQARTYLEQRLQGGGWPEGDLLPSDGFGLPRRLSPRYPVVCRYKTSFRADFLPEDLSLFWDRASIGGEFSLCLNGNRLDPADFASRPRYDFSNLSCPIRKWAVPGENELLVTVTVTKDWDGVVDSLFVAGAFEVKNTENGPCLCAPSGRGRYSNGVVEGYPFYSGELLFETDFPASPSKGRFCLEFDYDGLLCDCMTVEVNGVSLGTRAFSPYRWTGDGALLRPEGNHLALRVANTLSGTLDGRYYDYKAKKVRAIFSEEAPDEEERFAYRSRA